jgi:MSHA biogenesis protein MshP
MKPMRHNSLAAAARQAGFGTITVIIVLVVLASLAAAVVRIGSASNTATSQSAASARAQQAARAGTEWGLYQAFKGSWSNCSGASQTLDLSASTGLRVTVSCDAGSYLEGEDSPGVAHTVRVYTIDAVACSSATACPDNAAAARPGYVERRRRVQATD